MLVKAMIDEYVERFDFDFFLGIGLLCSGIDVIWTKILKK